MGLGGAGWGGGAVGLEVGWGEGLWDLGGRMGGGAVGLAG